MCPGLKAVPEGPNAEGESAKARNEVADQSHNSRPFGRDVSHERGNYGVHDRGGYYDCSDHPGLFTCRSSLEPIDTPKTLADLRRKDDCQNVQGPRKDAIETRNFGQ